MTSTMNTWLADVIGWGATYAIHSTILFGAAWLAVRFAVRSPRARDLAWKTAMIGALVTTSVQFGLGIEPVGGRFAVTAEQTLPVEVGERPAEQLPEVVVAQRYSVERAPVVVLRHYQRSREPRTSDRAGAALLSGRAQPPATTSVPPGLLAPGLLWLAGAGSGLLWLVLGLCALQRRLRYRRDCRDPRVCDLVDRLSKNAGSGPLRVTVNQRVEVPIAFGVLRREICLPGRALTLGDEELAALLAHEVAHHRHRDPAWRLLSLGLRAVFFFQPLNWLVVRRLERVSEERADDWAATETGRPLAMARCLTEVADWFIATPASPAVPAMARHQSELAHRVRRLVSGGGRSELGRRWRFLAVAAGALAVLSVAMVAPRASRAQEAKPAPAKKPASPAKKPAKKATGKPARPTKKPATPPMPDVPPVPEIPDFEVEFHFDDDDFNFHFDFDDEDFNFEFEFDDEDFSFELDGKKLDLRDPEAQRRLVERARKRAARAQKLAKRARARAEKLEKRMKEVRERSKLIRKRAKEIRKRAKEARKRALEHRRERGKQKQKTAPPAKTKPTPKKKPSGSVRPTNPPTRVELRDPQQYRVEILPTQQA